MVKVARNSIIYILLFFVQKTLNFFLLPLYTAYLSPTDYGVIGVVNSIGTYLAAIYSLSLNSAVTRLYYKHINDKEHVRIIWGTCITITALMVFLLTPLLVIFHRFLIDPFTGKIPFFPCIFLGILATALNPLYMLFQRSLQARQQGGRFAINNFIFLLTNAGLTILLVVVLKLKAVGALAALAISNAIFFVFSIVYFIPQVKLGINRKAAKESLGYSIPLIPHVLAGRINGTFDKLMMNDMGATAQVGLYNVGVQLSGVISTGATAVNQAFSPWFFQKAAEGEDLNKRTRQMSYMLIEGYLLLALGLSLFGKEILRIMASKPYWGAWTSLPLQAFAAAFAGVYYVSSNSLFLDRTKIVPLITIGTATMNITLNLFLIPRFSIMGAALSGLLTQIAQGFITMILSRKGNAMRLNPFRVFGLAFAAFGVGALAWVSPPGALGLILRIAAFIAIAAVFAVRYRSMLLNMFFTMKRRGNKP